MSNVADLITPGPDDHFPFVDVYVPSKFLFNSSRLFEAAALYDEWKEWLAINAKGHYIMEHIAKRHPDKPDMVRYRFRFTEERDATLFATAFTGNG